MLLPCTALPFTAKKKKIIYIYSCILIIMHCHILNHSRITFLGFLSWRWKQEIFCRRVEKILYHSIINWKPLLFFSFSQPEMASRSHSCQHVTMINKSPSCLDMFFSAVLESAMLGFKNRNNCKAPPAPNTNLDGVSEIFTLSIDIKNLV